MITIHTTDTDLVWRSREAVSTAHSRSERTAGLEPDVLAIGVDGVVSAEIESRTADSGVVSDVAIDSGVALDSGVVIEAETSDDREGRDECAVSYDDAELVDGSSNDNVQLVPGIGSEDVVVDGARSNDGVTSISTSTEPAAIGSGAGAVPVPRGIRCGESSADVSAGRVAGGTVPAARGIGGGTVPAARGIGGGTVSPGDLRRATTCGEDVRVELGATVGARPVDAGPAWVTVGARPVDAAPDWVTVGARPVAIGLPGAGFDGGGGSVGIVGRERAAAGIGGGAARACRGSGIGSVRSSGS